MTIQPLTTLAPGKPFDVNPAGVISEVTGIFLRIVGEACSSACHPFRWACITSRTRGVVQGIGSFRNLRRRVNHTHPTILWPCRGSILSTLITEYKAALPTENAPGQALDQRAPLSIELRRPAHVKPALLPYKYKKSSPAQPSALSLPTPIPTPNTNMSLSAFGTVPPGALATPVPFQLSFPAAQQEKLVKLVRQAEIAVPSYYNTHTDASNTSSLGLSRDWLVEAQEAWTSPGRYSWCAEQKRLNRFPQFRINVTTTTTTTTPVASDPNNTSHSNGTETETFDLHFAAIFSRNASATPLVLMHGWPGSWLEFGPLLDRLAARHTPDTLPYHVVVPSLPDYGLSTRRGELRRVLTMEGAAAAIDGLMGGLGFGGGYVAQGGDVGAILGQVLCAKFEACKALHCECGLGCLFGLDGLCRLEERLGWGMLTRW